MRISLLSIIVLFIFWQGYSHHPDLNMNFIDWMKNDPKLIFISNKSDTVKYEIDGHVLLIPKDHRLSDYHKTAKDTSYYADFLTVDTFPHHAPKFTILFEGCIAEANTKSFNHKFKFLGTELHDLAEFEVKHDNHRFFPHKEKEVKHMWWSISKGLLKYETRDGLIWTRLN